MITPDLEHFNRASQARRRADFNEAIAKLDACLCSNPHPLLEVLAWFNLGEVIFLNFELGRRPSVSLLDTQYCWSLRAREAIRRCIEKAEECSAKGVFGADDLVNDCLVAYQNAERLQQFFASYLENDKRRDLSKIGTILPLRCLTVWEQHLQSTPSNQSHGLRFDGCYISKLPTDYGMRDQPYSYLRFFEDGTAMEKEIRGTPSVENNRWFDENRNNPNVTYRTQYELNGDRIWFSFDGDLGSVEFSGDITPGGLNIQHVSHINGLECDDEYEFHEATHESASVRETVVDESLTRYKAVLGITNDLTESAIKDAFREKISKYHPDKVQHLGGEFKQLAEQKAAEINDAYEFLIKRVS